ncbi:hypothetical protein HOU00_gp236 [Caulobacter phage CcrPW]|uniref:Uncharacterized protein n=1 Tax=Caulobacter phage CcrPW TaxID=2283271 RepID=A0A385EDW5_9CAUD|nr:hypothetical protein HOU00_gp236 [Caulobacter phage CcrPW]AXQ68889.1 hypothetical protein CcrPW_gp350 [Caulobacter phage CcrPW]
MSYPDIAETIHLHPEQKWMPHEVLGLRAVFKPDDLVEIKDQWLADRVGVCVAHVSRFRWWAYNRRSGAYPMVELQGLPLKWYAAGFFRKIN